MKKLIVFLSFLLWAPALRAAGPASLYDERFAFTKDYIQTLGIFKGIETAAEALPKNDKEDVVGHGIQRMAFAKKGKSDIIAARDLLDKYRASKDKIVATTAAQIVSVYQLLADNMDERLKLFEDLYSPDVVKDFNQYQVAFMKRQSDLEAKTEEVYYMLTSCSVMVTYVMVKPEADKEGKKSYLVFNSVQRSELVLDLLNIFGDKIKDGFQEGFSYVDSAAVILYQVLSGPHKSLDDFKTSRLFPGRFYRTQSPA